MKYIIEFGVRGGAHTDNLILPTMNVACSLAASLVAVFENDQHAIGSNPVHWALMRHQPRLVWQSTTHFVAISKLDGVMRGPASAGLWRKSDAPPLISVPH